MSKKKIIFLVVIICAVLIGIGVYYINKTNRDYEVVEITHRNYFKLVEDGKVGIINTKGEILVKPIYDDIQIPNPLKPVFICLSNYNKELNTYKSIVKNDKDEQIFEKYDEVSAIEVNGIKGEIPYEKSALKYRKDNRYGLINFEGKELTNSIYEEIDSLPYKEGEFLVKKDGKYGVINSKGKQMLKIGFDNISGDGYFDGNYKNAGYVAGVKEDNGYLYSYIRNDGKTLLKNEFNDIYRITEIEGNKDIYLIVSKNGKKGVYKNSSLVVDCEYQDIEYNEDANIFIVNKNDKYGVFKLNGDMIVPVQNKEVTVRGIYIIVTNEDGVKQYDFSGARVINTKYKTIIATQNEEFSITVNQSNRYGVINKKEIEVIENKYAYIELLTDNYFAVYSDDNKIGVVDNNGRVMLDTKYDVIQKIKGSSIIQATQIENKTIELYTDEMKQIANEKNSNVYVYDNYIKMIGENSITYFNLDGEQITSRDIFQNNTLFATVKNGLWGFADRDGNTVIREIYDGVTEFDEFGYAGIKENGKWGIIDENGNIVLNPVYTIEEKNIEPEFLGKFYKANLYGDICYTNEIKE